MPTTTRGPAAGGSAVSYDEMHEGYAESRDDKGTLVVTRVVMVPWTSARVFAQCVLQDVTYNSSSSYQKATGAAVAGKGSGYVVNDLIYLTGGTFTSPVALQVTHVTSGQIDTVSILSPGIYTSTPANNVAQGSTSGSGAGATFTMNWGPGPGIINRFLPQVDPDYSYLYCRKCDLVPEVDLRGTSFYLNGSINYSAYAVFRLQFESFPHVILSDTDTATAGWGELARWVILKENFSHQTVTLEGNSLQWDTGSLAGRPIPAARHVVNALSTIHLTLVGWPVNAIPYTKMDLYEGTVNASLFGLVPFANYPAGSAATGGIYGIYGLLFTGAEQTDPYKTVSGTVVKDVTLQFSYANNASYGWNGVYCQPDGSIQRIKTRPTSPGNTPRLVYTANEFRDLVSPS